MRFQLPSAPGGTAGTVPSQQIVAPRGGPGFFVLIRNTSAVTVWVSESQQSLDGTVDNTGTPTVGFPLAPLGTQGDTIYFETCVTGLWARSQAPGGSLEVSAQPNC